MGARRLWSFSLTIYTLFYILYINVSWVDPYIFSNNYIKKFFFVKNDVSAYINDSGLGGIDFLLINYLIFYEDFYL